MNTSCMISSLSWIFRVCARQTPSTAGAYVRTSDSGVSDSAAPPAGLARSSSIGCAWATRSPFYQQDGETAELWQEP